MGDFEQLIQDIEAEARAEGPAAVAELAALEARFTLAAELIARRTGLGMTQKQLASASGIGQSEISRIERGEINPTVQTLGRLLLPLGARLAVAPVESKVA